MLSSLATFARGAMAMPKFQTFNVVRTMCDAPGMRKRGVCKWFNSEKGYGYITSEDGSGDIFVHQTELHCPGFRSLNEGATVEYDVLFNEAIGKTKAIKVTGPNGDFVETQARRPRDDFLDYN
eukprot:Pgem_evm1s17142